MRLVSSCCWHCGGTAERISLCNYRLCSESHTTIILMVLFTAFRAWIKSTKMWNWWRRMNVVKRAHARARARTLSVYDKCAECVRRLWDYELNSIPNGRELNWVARFWIERWRNRLSRSRLWDLFFFFAVFGDTHGRALGNGIENKWLREWQRMKSNSSGGYYRGDDSAFCACQRHTHVLPNLWTNWFFVLHRMQHNELVKLNAFENSQAKTNRWTKLLPHTFFCSACAIRVQLNGLSICCVNMRLSLRTKKRPEQKQQLTIEILFYDAINKLLVILNSHCVRHRRNRIVFVQPTEWQREIAHNAGCRWSFGKLNNALVKAFRYWQSIDLFLPIRMSSHSRSILATKFTARTIRSQIFSFPIKN